MCSDSKVDPLRTPAVDRIVDASLTYRSSRIRDSDDRKILDQFFDRRTLLNIYALMNDGIISTVDFPIATGKEGGVFRCTSPDGSLLALKIYRVGNAVFRTISPYISGDERFVSLSGNTYKLISAWAQREFANMRRYAEAGLRVPEAITFRGNMVAMGYIGSREIPAPLLKDASSCDYEALYDEVVDFMKKGFQKAHLVHSDLSPYNILVHEKHAFFIDLGQAVSSRNPNFLFFLSRDVTNINRFFKSKNVEVDDASIMERILKGD